ncbi:ATP-binding protein [Flavobacterium sp. FlaQc-48]|uniref:tetratricopeptide repeat-containing sensor histidine kinase n=1 Tax=Flavobacterium sp. FlaQc-48 TaxID=3374181 RepID=UPI0037567E7A
MKYIALLLFLCTSSLWSQDVSPTIQKLRNNLNRLNGETKLDSIGYLIENHLAKNNLSGFELQLVLFFQGNYYNQIGRTSGAIMALQKSIIQKAEGKEADRIYYKSLYILADLYFTKKDYKKAFFYAGLCRDKIPASNNKANEYIGIHLITGYYYYLNYDHAKSMQEFLLAEQAAKKYDRCKLSEVYVKTARIYSRKDQLDKAKKTITESIRIADSCDALENKINAIRTLREMLVEHGEFEAAHRTFEKLDRLVGMEDTKRRNTRIDSFEVANRIKLKEQQNINLKRINESAEIKLQKQKIALVASLIGISLLIILLYSIFVLTRKQSVTHETLKLQKKQIEARNSDLKRLNLLHQKIFTVISHDFKEPITTLKVLLGKEEILSNENTVVASYIKAISQQLEQSDAMLTSLLDWAKTELITTISSTSEVKLSDLIAAARRELSHQLKAKNITIENRVLKETSIVFNPTVLSIVLRNIIGNAIKFSYENSTIIIEYENNEIIIKDFGKGIEPKKIDKLFKKNINPGVGTNMESGFGMGLYLCQELMLKNKGTLDVFNNEPSGCIFKIILPK